MSFLLRYPVAAFVILAQMIGGWIIEDVMVSKYGA
jgi:hypothetical protein